MRRREDDPLSAFTKPPRNETPAQRAQRLAKEEQAKKISDAIDENLKAEKIALRKQKYIVRVLLLGQSGSGVCSSSSLSSVYLFLVIAPGKSTTLKSIILSLVFLPLSTVVSGRFPFALCKGCLGGRTCFLESRRSAERRQIHPVNSCGA